MNKNWLILVAAALTAAPMAYAHEPAGTPDTTCEDTAAERTDHDYGPPATGVLISGFQESNLEDCDGDFDPTDPFCLLEEAAREDLDGDTDVCEAFDYDEHSEYTRGGAWLLVNSGDGVTGGSVLCFGEAGHHPSFGPVQVDDAVLGQTVPFSVASDTVDATGLGDPCGDFQSDNGADCVATCSVTFPAGLDGSYQVYVGGSILSPAVGTQGHVCAPLCVPPPLCTDAADPWAAPPGAADGRVFPCTQIRVINNGPGAVRVDFPAPLGGSGRTYVVLAGTTVVIPWLTDTTVTVNAVDTNNGATGSWQQLP